MIESHIHLSHIAFDGDFPFIQFENGTPEGTQGSREELIKRLQEIGITACVEPAIEMESNQKLLALAKKYPDFIYPAVGVHPTRTYKYDHPIGINMETGKINFVKKTLYWKQRTIIRELASDPSVVAIGETGLDFHYNRKKLEIKKQHRMRQILWFTWQLLLADRLKKPVILHIREADRQALRILKVFRKRIHGGICHCFYGDHTLAEEYIKLGFAIGIGGDLISNKAHRKQIEDAVSRIPIDSIVLETDGPHLNPVSRKELNNSISESGKKISKTEYSKIRNTSLIIPLIAQRVAELKCMKQEDVEKITSENTARIFGLAQ